MAGSEGFGDDRSARTQEVAQQPAIKAAIFFDRTVLCFKYASVIVMIITYSDADNEADMEPGDGTPHDRGEPVSLMEPMRISESSRHRGELVDLAVELAAHSAGFRRSLPEGVLIALADLVRAMNCYYTNIIEGHDTHPVDIERALKNEYSTNAEKRNLQLEAKAHIVLQKWIDEGGLHGRTVSADGVREMHKRS